MELDLTREIRHFAEQRKIVLNSRQMQQIMENCRKRLNQTVQSAIKTIVEEEVEDFLIDQEDAELT